MRASQLLFFAGDDLVEPVDFLIFFLDELKRLLAFQLLLSQQLLLLLKFLLREVELVCGLVNFLGGAGCHDLRVLEVSLQLIVALLQLLDFLQLFSFVRSLLLLLLCEFVKQFGVARLGRTRICD